LAGKADVTSQMVARMMQPAAPVLLAPLHPQLTLGALRPCHPARYPARQKQTGQPHRPPLASLGCVFCGAPPLLPFARPVTDPRRCTPCRRRGVSPFERSTLGFLHCEQENMPCSLPTAGVATGLKILPPAGGASNSQKPLGWPSLSVLAFGTLRHPAPFAG